MLMLTISFCWCCTKLNFLFLDIFNGCFILIHRDGDAKLRSLENMKNLPKNKKIQLT